MDEYNVKITDTAINQINDILKYISQTLNAPQTALKWKSYLESEMLKLSYMPERYPLLDVDKWRSEAVRKMSIKNFLVYYFVNKDEKTVWIIAVIYGRSDQLSALTNLSFQ